MFFVALLGFAWMAGIIMLVRNEDWQFILALPGSAAFLIGMIGGAVQHISIYIH